ncbi:MAG: mono/diheme cytochrome c family protein [Planctomycetota bacterium]|jgi:mono/diheme cytochrome c family protein
MLRLGIATVLSLFASPFAFQEEGEVPQSSSDKELFLVNCATCHGVLGDGEGVTDLDRKARSFKAGGFSFGNTPGAVQRTITSGIPGTPMPAFGEALNAKQIAALAIYVIELGPGLPPEPKNTELVVKDQPVVVRGMLPPIAPECVTRTRAILVGMPDGFSFEYRTDDVRLLGIRQGGFVDRTDWGGRGGTALKPLGTVVKLIGGGDPGPSFHILIGESATALEARLTGTELADCVVYLKYGLHTADGELLARVRESCRSQQTHLGLGFRREWKLVGVAPGIDLLGRNLGTQLLLTDSPLSIEQRTLADDQSEVSAWWQSRDGAVPLDHNGKGHHPLFRLEEGQQTTLIQFSIVGPSDLFSGKFLPLLKEELLK